MSRWKFPTLWRYMAREMRRRPGRMVLTLAGIAIGVATIVATSVTIEVSRHAYRDLFEAATGRASLEVVAPGSAGFDRSVVTELENMAGVKAALPAIQAPAALVGKSGPGPVLVLGIDPGRDHLARDYTFRQGQQLGDKDGILLEAGFAAAHTYEVGQSVRLWTPTGLVSLPIVGLLEPRSAATFNGGAIVFIPLGTAQRLFGLGVQINAVHLVLEDNANKHEVESEVQEHVPSGLLVQAPAKRGTLAQETLVHPQRTLGSLGVGSLVAGAFVILNSFLMNVGERRRQLAILRALGATRGQITRLLLREALILGVVGTILGIVVGIVLTLTLLHVVTEAMQVAEQDVRWSPKPFLLALLLGPGMSLAATFLPARHAGHRPLLEVLVTHGRSQERRFCRWPCYVGLGLLAVPFLLDIGSRRGWFSSSITPGLLAVSTVAFLVGSGLVLPLVLPPLLHFAGLILKPFLGMTSGLAIRYLDRHPARTALTVGVLMIAVIVTLVFGSEFENRAQDLLHWSEEFFYGDFYISSAISDLTSQVTGTTLPESVGTELRALDGVEHVDNLSFTLTRAGGHQVLVLAMTFSPQGPFPLELVKGDRPSVSRSLLQGDVILGMKIAWHLGLDSGDAITLETPHGPRSLRVVGIAKESNVGMSVTMDWSQGERLFNLKGVHCFVVTAKRGATRALADQLQSFRRNRGLLVQSKAEFREWGEGKVKNVVVAWRMLLALVFVVASMGIVNTLTMSLLEQTREMGVLRALGMKRGQVRALFLCQALAIGMAGLIPGLSFGILWSYWIGDSLSGRLASLRIDPWLIGGCCITALAVPVLVAQVPARRAAKLQIVRALRYE